MFIPEYAAAAFIAFFLAQMGAVIAWGIRLGNRLNVIEVKDEKLEAELSAVKHDQSGFRESLTEIKVLMATMTQEIKGLREDLHNRGTK